MLVYTVSATLFGLGLGRAFALAHEYMQTPKTTTNVAIPRSLV
jgi:hypothetical protein